MEPSKYQKAIIDWVETGEGSAIIEAVAGSGKTTTIVAALSHIPQNKRAIFLAFNKSIATELQSRIPQHATAATFHSVGFRAWTRKHRFCQVDDRKVNKILRETISYEDNQVYGQYIVQLVGIAKQAGVGCLIENDFGTLRDLAEHFDLRIDNPDRNYDMLEKEAILIVQDILKISNKQSDRVIDYNDMIYMPVRENLQLEQYDWVFIDEAQDTNGTRRELAKRMLATNGRLVAVGDTHQAIYGFTGANSDAMELIRADFNCQIFPLSVSYRCSKNIVATAKQYISEIESFETSPDGEVKATNILETPPKSTDAILCRNTAPLVSLAYQLIANGIGCKVLGSEIGRNLANLINKLDATDILDLETKLIEYQRNETERLMRRDQESKIQNVIDKVTCIQIIISNLTPTKNTIQGLIEQIGKLFSDVTNGMITLSTIHKAKGLEWPNVYIYRPDLMPSNYAKQPWQLQQEINLQYVATTRAKVNLYYLMD